MHAVCQPCPNLGTLKAISKQLFFFPVKIQWLIGRHVLDFCLAEISNLFSFSTSLLTEGYLLEDCDKIFPKLHENWSDLQSRTHRAMQMTFWKVWLRLEYAVHNCTNIVCTILLGWIIIRKKSFLWIHEKRDCLKYAKKKLNKLENSFVEEILWTDRTKMELLSLNCTSYIWGKKGDAFEEKKSCQLLSIGVALLCFGFMWQPVAQEILGGWKEKCVQLNINITSKLMFQS